MKIREHLSYSNVAATIALVVALGTGGAYAAGEIGSGDIDNDSIRSKDLRDRKAVKTEDVKRDGLTGKAIRERTLDAGEFASLASDVSGFCNPTDGDLVDCSETSVALPRAGRLLVIATGDYFSSGSGSHLSCKIAIDGVNEPGAVTPGEVEVNTSSIASDGFARTRITQRLAKGRHRVGLRCSEPGSGDGRLTSATLSVLGITGG